MKPTTLQPKAHCGSIGIKILSPGLLLLAVLLAGPPAATAAEPVNLLKNGSFELTSATNRAGYLWNKDGSNPFTIDDWEWASADYGYLVGTKSDLGPAQDGEWYLNLLPENPEWIGTGISQSFAVTAGKEYTVHFWSRNRAMDDASTLEAAVKLKAGTATGDTSLATNSRDADWTEYAFSFTPNTSTNATLTFRVVNGRSRGSFLDNVSVFEVKKP